MYINSILYIKIYSNLLISTSIVLRARSFEIVQPCSTSVDEETALQVERNASPLARLLPFQSQAPVVDRGGRPDFLQGLV